MTTSMFYDYFNVTEVDKLWPGMAPAAVVLQLDVLFGILAILTWVHACSLRGAWKGSALVLFLAFHTAFFEHVSLFLGGTHCHATSPVLPMITPCSSVNSVLFYVPWIYTSIEASRRLLAANRIHLLAFPFVVGLLQFGFGVVYEMQGPINNFWNWPNTDTDTDTASQGVIAESLKWLGPWENYPGLAALEDAKAQHAVATIDASGVFSVSSHAQMALEERLFGFPVLAPYFHFAYGFAWALALTLMFTLSNATTTTIPSLASIVVSGLHSTLLFVVPIELTRNLTHAIRRPYRVGVPVSLGLSLLPIVLLRNRNPSETKTKNGSSSATAEDANTSSSSSTDPLLFSISFLMHAFMVSFPWRALTPTPSGLVLLVTTISTLHLAAQFYCCFIVSIPSQQSQSQLTPS